MLSFLLKSMVWIVVCYFSSSSIYGDVEEIPKKIGNFALRSSQEPGAFISFGENIIDKGEVIVYFFEDDYVGRKKHYADIIPSILYGITDNFSVYFNVPYAIDYKDHRGHSSGLEDMFLQFEYAYYNDADPYSARQATIVTNISFPTGSAQKDLPTGNGVPTVFLGTTYNYMGFNWFYFSGLGALVTKSKKGTKIGNEYLYQFGFGRNFGNLPGWLFAWIIETTGQYTERNKISGQTDPNSGGNIIYVTPSLWISSEHLIIQIGAGYAAYQYLFGQQGRSDYLLALNFGWAF